MSNNHRPVLQVLMLLVSGAVLLHGQYTDDIGEILTGGFLLITAAILITGARRET